jgi:starch synthase (maltosyl-transferring)
MARSAKRRSKTNNPESAPPGDGAIANDAQRGDAVSPTREETSPTIDVPREAASQGSVEPREDAATTQPPAALALRVIIEHVEPQVDDGRFPAKRVVGDTVDVLADIFADGHDVIVAVLRHRRATSPGQPEEPWREAQMRLTAPGTDRWTAPFTVDSVGWYEFAVVAWVDPFATWRRELRLKADAKQDVGLELIEGANLVREAAARASQIGAARPDAWQLATQADLLCAADVSMAERVEIGVAAQLAEAMFTFADRRHATHHLPLRIRVDRERARFGAWYEMFPRSAGPDASRSATFTEAAGRLPAIAGMGFDVVYLPPIHPIGRSFRKGPNNALKAEAGDPGSPWAIGSAEGGHTAVEPGLGTLEDFEDFQREAHRLDLEIALDLAWQCSPDHPWVTEHPEWFRHRPDGSIKYAENPPKKYQDIYPLDFACNNWRELWHALLDVTRFWMKHGVRIFRVDNPHTKSFGFWEWLIAETHAEFPDTIFLAEAFTRPRLMQYLAKAGFTQSYTYFTWRNTKEELEEYLTELTTTEMREYFRPNFFANTPDILHEYLQAGGRPAFEARLVLAATLSPTYGIYSGFELCENRSVRPGSEEYLNSEKYQIRHWDWDRPGNIVDVVTAVNKVRREHTALRSNESLLFCETDNPQLIAYTKTAPDRSELLLTVVNLDTRYMQHGHVEVPVKLLGITGDTPYTVHDLLSDTDYVWTGSRAYVRLDPGIRQAHILRIAFQADPDALADRDRTTTDTAH